MNVLQLNNSLFLILAVFFLTIWIYVVFFYCYWTIKERDSKDKKSLSQSHYAPFATILKIKFKKTEIEHFYFEETLPFFQQKKISSKLFLAFLSNKYHVKKMQLYFQQIIKLTKKNTLVPDFVLPLKVGNFRQKYLLHFVKMTNSVVVVIFTNWIDN